MKALRLFLILTFVGMPLRGVAADENVMLMPKQLLVLKPGLDMVSGTWVAAVKNNGDKEASFKFPVLMPADARDFSPIEGLSSEQIQLGDTGLMIERSFPPGVTVVSLGFLLPSTSGRATIRLKSSIDVGELTLMTPRGLLDIHSPDLSEVGADVQDMQRYSVWATNTMLLANQSLVIGVSGIPEGRTKLWMIGGIFASVLAVGAGVLTRRTATRIQSSQADDLA